MVARTIPKNYRNITGRLASSKNQRLVGFESTLEKDFYLLLEFDSDVASYEEQPVTISYNAFDGQQHHYTPDVLVHYQPSADAIPALCEVKGSVALIFEPTIYSGYFLGRTTMGCG